MQVKGSGCSQTFALRASASCVAMYSANRPSKGWHICGHCLKHSGENEVAMPMRGFVLSGHTSELAEAPTAEPKAIRAAERRAIANRGDGNARIAGAACGFLSDQSSPS